MTGVLFSTPPSRAVRTDAPPPDAVRRFHALDQPLQDFAGRDVIDRVAGQVHLLA
jgi:hypothetical protein